MFVCNNYCRSRGFFTYNLTLTLEFEINATDSRNVGKLNVTGTETLESIVWDNWNQTCVSSSQIEPINETDNLYIPIDIYKVDPITHFLPSYNDFDSFLGDMILILRILGLLMSLVLLMVILEVLQ